MLLHKSAAARRFQQLPRNSYSGRNIQNNSQNNQKSNKYYNEQVGEYHWGFKAKRPIIDQIFIMKLLQ